MQQGVSSEGPRARGRPGARPRLCSAATATATAAATATVSVDDDIRGRPGNLCEDMGRLAGDLI
jgi:hypothetical protein